MHYFDIASNLCQRFTIGYPDEPDRFFLRGDTVNDKPIVSCRVYSADGRVLFGLQKNNLTPETSPRFRFMLTKDNWHRIVDDEGNEVLRIETSLDPTGNDVSRIIGEFRDRDGTLAAKGSSEGLLVNCPLTMS